MRILRSPGLLLIAVLMLAVGLGGNLAMFALLDRLILRPMAIPQQTRLVEITAGDRAGAPRGIRPTEFEALSRNNAHLDLIAKGSWKNLLLTGVAEPEDLWSFEVSAEFFPLLGVQPVYGRTLNPADNEPGADRVVLLSHGTWRKHFGGDPAVVGRQIRLGGSLHRVVGVMGPGFAFPRPIFVIWTPSTNGAQDARGAEYFGRLRDGATLDAANRDLAKISPTFASEERRKEGWHCSLRPITESLVKPYRRTLWTLTAAVGVLLLIACANVAGLLLVRATGRAKEFAMRAALGASPSHLFRLILGEVTVIVALAAAAGVALASLVLRLFENRFPEALPAAESLHLSAPVLLAGLGLTAISVLIASAAPLWLARRNWSLATSRTAASDPAAHRFRKVLLGTQIALAVVLTSGAGLLTRSLLNTLSVQFCFDPTNVLTARVPAPASLKDPAAIADYYSELLSVVRRTPGVSSSGVITILPLGGVMTTTTFQAEGAHPRRESGETEGNYPTHLRAVYGDYFQAMGVRLLRGRMFNSNDRATSPPVVVINRELAEHFWPGEDPLGKRVSRDQGAETKNWLTVVGVVENTRHVSLEQKAEPEIFRPLTQEAFGALASSLVVRASGDSLSLGTLLAQSIHERFPDQPVSKIQPMDAWIDLATLRARTTTAVLLAFAGAALLMSLSGVFAVAAYVARSRRRDLAVRSALGATPGDLRKHVAGSVASPLVFGTLAGLLGAVVLARYVESELYEVKAIDPLTLASAAMLILMGGIAALYLPARRAALIDPATELRAE